MPYVRQDERFEEGKIIEPAGKLIGDSPGRLNYAITMLIQEYILANRPCYKTFNEVIGVLECAKLELYRRVVALYEDKKIKDNGDVYDLEALLR